MSEIKNPKPFNHLQSITSIDGRFRGRVEKISEYFSEFATIKGRVFVEVEYLISLLKQIGKPLSDVQQKKLRSIVSNFSEKDAMSVWNKDEEINHDTKAVEYFLTDKLKKTGLSALINFLHFGLTSSDID